MKFSLKTLALAVALAASATGASAAIDNGAGGNGELFFSAFDGTSSYSFDLNLTINDFETALSTTGLLDLSWGKTTNFSSSFSSWLATANTSSLQWNVLATDQVGQRRILATVDNSVAMPATNKAADVLRTAATNIGTTVTAINTVIVNDSAVTTSTTAASYAGTMSSFYPKFTIDTTGDLADNSYANGLTFEKTLANAGGTTAGTNTAYSDGTSAVKVWLAADQTLHFSAVTAVPEPESYAMLLAGLGLLSVVARRRLNNRV